MSDILDRDISRRELYAMGEPLGDGATRRKLGGGYICGIGGKSKSSTATTTNNADNRMAIQNGIGLSNSSGSVLDFSDRSTNNWDSSNRSTNYINTLDGGAISRAFDSVDLSSAATFGTTSRALDSIDLSGKRLNDGFQSLIDAATGIFNEGQSLIGQTQKSVADAYSTAQTDKAGGIDQKTIIVLAVAGAVALYAINRK